MEEEKSHKEKLNLLNQKNFVSGKTLYKTEWEGQAGDMPPTKIDERVKLYEKQTENNPFITRTIEDFNNYLDENLSHQFFKFFKSDYPYDINDPRNIPILEKIKNLKTDLLLRFLYKEYMLPFFEFESLRQKILFKRVEKNSMKNLKIPLLEKQIENDEDLQHLMKNILQEKEKTTQEEMEKKIKLQLELLNKNHSGTILSDEQFYSYINDKIKTLKKDVVKKIQYSYFQIIHEYYHSSDIFKFLKNITLDLCEQNRRLRPKRKKNNDKTVERCSKIKISVHVIKGYNLPIRLSGFTPSQIEKYRDEQIGKIIGNVRKTQSNNNFNFRNMFNQRNNSLPMNNSLRNNSNINMGMGLNNMPPQFPQGGFGQNNFNMMNPMNNMNPNINNSQLFNNVGTLNNSMNDMNFNMGNNIPNIGNISNNQIPIMPNMQIPQMMPDRNPSLNPNNMMNPNFNNILSNPNASGSLPAYNMPQMYMRGNDQMSSENDNLFRMVEKLQSMEKNVQSFVDVNLTYYDQKINMRTDSIDGVHPDYNYKMQFEITPNEGEEAFTNEELIKTNGGLAFTVFDEVRKEDIILEKGSNTYIYKYEKKYLGSLYLPFTTIFQNRGLLETVSKINVPMTVFGYYSDTSTAFDVENKKEEDARKQKNFMENNMNQFNSGNEQQNNYAYREGNKNFNFN